MQLHSRKREGDEERELRSRVRARRHPKVGLWPVVRVYSPSLSIHTPFRRNFSKTYRCGASAAFSNRFCRMPTSPPYCFRDTLLCLSSRSFQGPVAHFLVTLALSHFHGKNGGFFLALRWRFSCAHTTTVPKLGNYNSSAPHIFQSCPSLTKRMRWLLLVCSPAIRVPHC